MKSHPSTGPTNFSQAYLDCVPDNDQEKVRSKWKNAIEKGKPFALNHGYLQPDGEKSQLRVQVSPVQRGVTPRYLGFVQVVEPQEAN
jgi:hypothetical protein